MEVNSDVVTFCFLLKVSDNWLHTVVGRAVWSAYEMKGLLSGIPQSSAFYFSRGW